MKRYVTLEEISDGKLYTARDMVKADCMGCEGCSKCCRGMGDTILLDPYDVWRFQKGLGKGLNVFMAEGTVALGVVDGVILPHLVMQGKEEKCGFLDENGRCTIHAWRPGICRLFPLGRYYENGSFRYFLQKEECDKPKAKIKVEKWLETEHLERYEEFIRTWHALFLRVEELCAGQVDDAFRKNLNLHLLETFFFAPYNETEAFYDQFDERMARMGLFVKTGNEAQKTQE